MSNLYYEVLFPHRPDMALERTYYSLSDFYSYLKGVEDHLNATRLTLRWDLGGHLVDLLPPGSGGQEGRWREQLRDILDGLEEEPDSLRLRTDGCAPLEILRPYPREPALLLADALPGTRRDVPCELVDRRGKVRLRCIARRVPRPSLEQLLRPPPPTQQREETEEQRRARTEAEAALKRWQDDPLVQRLHRLQPVWIALREPEADGDRTAEAFLDEEVEAVYEDRPERRGSYSDETRLSITGRDPERLMLELGHLPSTSTICIRPNTYTVSRQRKAIEQLQNAPTEMQKPLLNLFQRQDHVTWPSFHPAPVVRWQVLTEEERPGTLEQRAFVQRALATPDFMLLEGPPGSGKTTAILELVLQLAARGKRALLCASTHVAVDNVIERIKDRDNPQRDAVLVVRIGKAKDVRSELAREFCLERMAKTESRELREQLDRRSVRTPSQELLREALRPPKGEETWEKTLLDCAQLVCGTTIGILQHPALKQSEVPFDYLILDEASKTTFAEFLVPAVRAKRWIVVGDRRQLSPYVDEEWIASAVLSALTKSAGDSAQEVARERIATFNREQAAAGGRPIQPDRDAQRKDPARHWADQIGWRLIREYELRLIGELRAGPASDADDQGDEYTEEDEEGDEPEDEDELGESDGPEGDDGFAALFEAALRGASEEAERPTPAPASVQTLVEDELLQRYRAERQRLLPAGDAGARVREALDRVRRAALPSVLESLQVGNGEDLRGNGGNALALGLPQPALRQRLVSLRFQHRMHPEISEFPRRHIYLNKNLHDPPDQAARRELEQPPYPYRSLWIDVQGPERKERGSLFNESEAKVMLRELGRLADWAARHPRRTPDRYETSAPWSVALLSFYRGQERILRNELRALTGEQSHRQHFTLRRDGRPVLTLDLCTVDRFQGHEADFVYLSLVRTRSIGFLRSPNRLNVALTRARYQRVIVGSKAFYRGRRCQSELLRELASCTASSRAYGEDQP